jgi:hypothetical protein
MKMLAKSKTFLEMRLMNLLRNRDACLRNDRATFDRLIAETRQELADLSAIQTLSLTCDGLIAGFDQVGVHTCCV